MAHAFIWHYGRAVGPGSASGGGPLRQGHLFPALPVPSPLPGEPYSTVGALLGTRFSHPEVVLVPSP